jgi:hypothetical protein
LVGSASLDRGEPSTGLAEAGCSANEIMAISGHTTMKEITRYTVAADQAAATPLRPRQGDRHVPKKLAVALCLAAMATSACAEESKVGTAWQCDAR